MDAAGDACYVDGKDCLTSVAHVRVGSKCLLVSVREILEHQLALLVPAAVHDGRSTVRLLYRHPFFYRSWYDSLKPLDLETAVNQDPIPVL